MAFLPALVNLEYLNLSYCNRITEKTFDVNFEKADADVNGSFAIINREMARMVRGLGDFFPKGMSVPSISLSTSRIIGMLPPEVRWTY